jgi:hypothetical protein
MRAKDAEDRYIPDISGFPYGGASRCCDRKRPEQSAGSHHRR